MKRLIVCLLAFAVLSAPQGKQTFTGTITDDECSRADHSRMRMGPTDAECVRACISAHGASCVLYDGKDIYTLSDQRTPERFAGQKVARRRRARREYQDHQGGVHYRGELALSTSFASVEKRSGVGVVTWRAVAPCVRPLSEWRAAQRR
jgi:hypothetical protein